MYIKSSLLTPLLIFLPNDPDIVPIVTLTGRCALAEREDMVTVPRSLTVEVGTPAVLTWLDLPASVTEDEEAEFGCQAVGGHPRPRVEVTGLANLRRASQQSSGGRAGKSAREMLKSPLQMQNLPS